MEFAELIQKAKEDGVCVSGEVCPHHFSMTEDDILEDDANYKMNPPLRTAAVLQTVQNVPQYSKRFRKDFVNLKQSLLSVTANSRQHPAVSAAR
mgnify:CR=1 FL=1